MKILNFLKALFKKSLTSVREGEGDERASGKGPPRESSAFPHRVPLNLSPAMDAAGCICCPERSRNLLLAFEESIT